MKLFRHIYIICSHNRKIKEGSGGGITRTGGKGPFAYGYTKDRSMEAVYRRLGTAG